QATTSDSSAKDNNTQTYTRLPTSVTSQTYLRRYLSNRAIRPRVWDFRYAEGRAWSGLRILPGPRPVLDAVTLELIPARGQRRAHVAADHDRPVTLVRHQVRRAAVSCG